MAELAKAGLRTKLPALAEALTGRFTEHHAFMAPLHLDQIDQLSAAIADVTERIEVVIEPVSRLPESAGHHPRDQPPDRRRHRRGDRW